jgi:predicted acylesterase/phospholipase RssA
LGEIKVEKKKVEKKKVAIALQGGGAHGAFAWGGADKLLEDGRFEILGVSGTSAGGMNAAAIVQGLIKGGTEAARATLRDYWREMSDLSKKISPFSNFSKSLMLSSILIFPVLILSPTETPETKSLLFSVKIYFEISRLSLLL